MLDIIVNVAGLLSIVWVVWYFWLAKSEKEETVNMSSQVQEASIEVKGGYNPNLIRAKAGTPLVLHVTRREASTCGEELVLPDFSQRVYLPQNETIDVTIPPTEPGRYEFTCGMGMYRGTVEFLQ